MVTIVKGSDKNIIVRLDGTSADPFDLTGASLIRACFIKDDDTSLYVYYLPRTGDIVSGSDIVSNIDTANISEGMPITGNGIPAKTTVLKTPTSTTSPTAAGTIKISANATSTATSVSLSVGEIAIITAILGKFRISLREEQTDTFKTTDEGNFEVMIVIDDFTTYVQFPASLNIVDRYC